MSRAVNILKRLMKKGPQLLEGFQLKKAKNLLYYIKHNQKWTTELNTIFIESKNGEDLAGNMLSILIELRSDPQYKGYSITVPYAKGKKEEFEKIFENYNLKDIELVPYCSKKYFEKLTKAKYWINDSTFLANVIKKPDQIYLNTWHGTPWKCMGRPSDATRVELGNVQRNFMMANYLVWPNEFTREKMTEGYMLEQVCTSTQGIVTGYPRNDFFINPRPMGLSELTGREQGTKFYMYLPTWRPSGDKTQQVLEELDKRMQDNECLLVKLHPLQKGSINLDNFKHITEPPKGYGLYHTLSHCACLISDYSSVIFDYAHLTNASIVLYPYDKDSYETSRGLYFTLEECGLPVASDTKDLYAKIQNLPQVPKAFKDKFCDFSSSNSTKALMEHVLRYETKVLKPFKVGTNTKPNVLIHAGNLDKNGVTASLLNFVNYLDSTNRYNIILSFKTNLAKPNAHVLTQIPDTVAYIPRRGQMNIPLLDQLFLMQYPLLSKFHAHVRDIVLKSTETEFARLYPGMEFDTVIQFTGYSFQELYQYQKVKARNHVVFVHSDMEREIATRGNQHRPVLEYVYPRYDKVCLVSKHLTEATKSFAKSDTNFYEVVNMIDHKKIKAMGDEAIEFEKVTKSNTTPIALKATLQDADAVFCTIGRFSKEKGHPRLIDAFNQVEKDNPDKKLALVIIGGCGEEYNNTLKHGEYAENILCIQNMRNPQAVIRRCSCFVLSSYYEGQPMVFAEADIQGLPVISTDIPAAHELLSVYGGHLCEDSTEGLIQGMQAYLNGEIKPMNINFEEFNSRAASQIDKVMDYEAPEMRD